MLVQTLESNGTLSKLRAQLSASVFLALEKQEPTQNKTPLLNTKLKDFLNTKDGSLAAGLVREFLEFFNMDFTEVVFDEESGMSTEYGKRDILIKELNLANNIEDPSKQAPLLSQTLKQAKKTAEESASITSSSPAKTSTNSLSLSQNCIAEARKKFEQYEKDHDGTIEKDDVTNLFSELFPDFHRTMLERFVHEECRDAEKRNNSHSINFEEFLTMYKHLFDFCKKVVLRHESLAEANTKNDSFLTFSPPANRLPSLNMSPTKGVLSNHISTSFNKPDGNGILKSDQMSWNSDGKPAKSPEPKSFSQHSSSRSNLLPTAPEEDPFFDDPFLPASSGLKTFGRDDEDDPKSPTQKNGTLYQAKPITVIPKQSKKETVKMTNSESSTDDDAEDDYDDDDDFHSEGKTPRTTSHSEAPKSLKGGEEIEEELDFSEEADDLLKSEGSELADLTTDKTLSQPDAGFDYMEDVLSS